MLLAGMGLAVRLICGCHCRLVGAEWSGKLSSDMFGSVCLIGGVDVALAFGGRWREGDWVTEGEDCA